MHGMRHHGHCGERGERFAAGRRWGRHQHGGGRFGRHGGGGDMMRAGRMLAQGDIRLIALALIAEQPRHGYEIIKVLEDKTAGWYSPSPGIVYPTLTYLEEAGHIAGVADGGKKLYSITEEGRAHVTENKDFIDAVMERFTAVGVRMAREREHEAVDARHDAAMPRSIRGAFQDLSEAARDLLRANRDAKSRVIEIIDRATDELKRKN